MAVNLTAKCNTRRLSIATVSANTSVRFRLSNRSNRFVFVLTTKIFPYAYKEMQILLYAYVARTLIGLFALHFVVTSIVASILIRLDSTHKEGSE